MKHWTQGIHVINEKALFIDIFSSVGIDKILSVSKSKLLTMTVDGNSTQWCTGISSDRNSADLYINRRSGALLSAHIAVSPIDDLVSGN